MDFATGCGLESVSTESGSVGIDRRITVTLPLKRHRNSDLFVIAPLAGSLKISNNSLIVASGVDHSEGLLLRHHPDAIPVRAWGMSHEVLATPDISGGQLVFGMAAERLLELGDGV
jgi:hypothetical protein